MKPSQRSLNSLARIKVEQARIAREEYGKTLLEQAAQEDERLQEARMARIEEQINRAESLASLWYPAGKGPLAVGETRKAESPWVSMQDIDEETTLQARICTQTELMDFDGKGKIVRWWGKTIHNNIAIAWIDLRVVDSSDVTVASEPDEEVYAFFSESPALKREPRIVFALEGEVYDIHPATEDWNDVDLILDKVATPYKETHQQAAAS